MRSSLIAMTLAIGLATTTSSAQTIYDNFNDTPSGSAYVECFGGPTQTCADDMTVSGGGRLVSFRYRLFNNGGGFIGGSEFQNYDIGLLLDDGNGAPDPADTVLYMNSYTNVNMPFQSVYEGTESLFADNINVASGDTIWAVVTGLGFNMGLRMNDLAPTAGSTDGNVYRFGGDFNDTVDAAGNGQSGWQLQLTAIPVPEPGTLSLLGLGAIALIRRRR